MTGRHMAHEVRMTIPSGNPRHCAERTPKPEEKRLDRGAESVRAVSHVSGLARIRPMHEEVSAARSA